MAGSSVRSKPSDGTAGFTAAESACRRLFCWTEIGANGQRRGWMEGKVAELLGQEMEAKAEGSDPETWGAAVKRYRLDRGLTLRQLARRLGVNRDTVREWESLGRVPQSKIRKRIAEELGTDSAACDAQAPSHEAAGTNR